MDTKRKPRMGLGVSTKVENAWYVDPELLAAEGQAATTPVDEDGLPPEDTVALNEGDLDEAPEALTGEDEDARHYRKVSLRGALLAPDDPTSPSVPVLATDAGGRRPGSIGPARAADLLAAATAALAAGARFVGGLLEPGRFHPVWVAVGGFVLGVVFTLIGVVLAL